MTLVCLVLQTCIPSRNPPLECFKFLVLSHNCIGTFEDSQSNGSQKKFMR